LIPVGSSVALEALSERIQINRQFDNGFGEGADEYGARAAMESSRFKEKTGSEKELAHN
jgi:hypothetical protein